MRKPRYYDTFFGEIVKEAVKSGELTFENLKEWEREYNCGVEPKPDMGTRGIMEYYLRGGER